MTIQERLFPATSMPDQDWWQALWPDPDSVVRALRIEPGMTVVDLGCGDGYFTAAITRQIGSGRVIGFDLDPVMLEQAKVACNGLMNCDWLLGDAMELSRLIGASADYVLIANTFHGVPGKTALAREIAASLGPSGRFAIVNWHVIPREETSILGHREDPVQNFGCPPSRLARWLNRRVSSLRR